MVPTIEPTQEGICPPVPTMERGVVVRVEVTRRWRVKVPRERSGQVRGWLVRRYTLTRTIACDPLARTIQPSHTHPLEDRPNGGLVSTRPMCIRPASDSHSVWCTHRLPSLVVGHGTPRTSPEPLGPFMLRLVPIRACHPEPIDGWLTSLQSQPHCPCPCACMWRIIHHCPTESPASTAASAVTSPSRLRRPRLPVRRLRDLPIPVSDPHVQS